jgi:hypothetical protein
MAPDPMAAERLDLPELQRWMQARITSSSSEEPDSAVISHVLPSRFLSSEERVGIYRDMIALRLLDCLEQEFPALHHALGHERFAALCRDYLLAHPSTHPNLNRLGAHLSRFLRARPSASAPAPFLSELAALERAIQVVFDEREEPPLPGQSLLELPREQWPRARLSPIRALRLLAFDYPVNAYLQAWREDREPKLPAARATWTVVYRKDYRVWRADLDRERFELLCALGRGCTLEESLRACLEVPAVDAERLLGRVQLWFQEWTSEGFFARLDT